MQKNKHNVEAHKSNYDEVVNGMLKFQYYNHVDDVELANKAGLSISTIHKMKQKKTLPHNENTQKIEKNLNRIAYNDEVYKNIIKPPMISKPP